MFTIHLGAVVLGIYFLFSLIGLIWGIVRLSTATHNSDMNAFYSGLVMFILGTWKGMTISMLHQLLGTCNNNIPREDEQEHPGGTPPAPVGGRPSSLPVLSCP